MESLTNRYCDPVVLSNVILFSSSGLNANTVAAETAAKTSTASMTLRIVLLLHS